MECPQHTDVIETEACSKLYSALPSVRTLREAAIAKTRRVIRRKNMLIDQRKLDAAKAALGAQTETAAVDAAIDLVVFHAEVFRGLDALVAVGGLAAPIRRAGGSTRSTQTSSLTRSVSPPTSID